MHEHTRAHTRAHALTRPLCFSFSPARVSDPAPLTIWWGHTGGLSLLEASESLVLCCRSWSWPLRYTAALAACGERCGRANKGVEALQAVQEGGRGQQKGGVEGGAVGRAGQQQPRAASAQQWALVTRS